MHSFITSQVPALSNSPDILEITGETSIGIDQVREIQSFLAKRPFQSKNNTIIIIDAHLLTIPAQNALLKTLEEPPGQSEIYLITSQPELLLPTVLSRCELLKTKLEISVIASETKQSIETFINSKSISEKILLLDSQSFTRESLSKFLDALELYLHQNLNDPLVIGHWDLVIEARKFLRANCSLRLLTTHLTACIL